jgi:histidyl-tRNA synthetase
MAEKPRGPRGTPDLFPPESEVLARLEDAARVLCDRFGYRRVETPMFEHTDVFERSAGDSSDVVVQKQMYTFEDAGGRSISLRPEGTAGVARAYIQHRPDGKLGLPLRLYYVGPFFRYERPAKGVDREFICVGVEYIGSASPVSDAEVIALAERFYATAGVSPELLLNTIGCPNDRAEFIEALKQSLADHVDDLCDDCHRRLQTNPMRVFDCKVPADQKIIRKYAPSIRDYLCDACKEHHASVERILESLGIAWKDTPDLVRGLDYYTRTVFEFVVPGLPTLGAGGRYDLLIEQLGGQPTPATGFALGLTRTMKALPIPDAQSSWHPDVHVIWLEGLAEVAVAMAMDLRAAGMRVTVSDDARSMRSQMNEANRLGAGIVVILGPDEASRQVARVKQMSSGDEREVAFGDLVKELSS